MNENYVLIVMVPFKCKKYLIIDIFILKRIKLMNQHMKTTAEDITTYLEIYDTLVSKEVTVFQRQTDVAHRVNCLY